jgi:hypothetical protein
MAIFAKEAHIPLTSWVGFATNYSNTVFAK